MRRSELVGRNRLTAYAFLLPSLLGFLVFTFLPIFGAFALCFFKWDFSTPAVFVGLIPQFILIKNLGLSDSHWALILLQAFSPFGVFLLRQFYLTIPDELLELARIDGLGEFGIYRRIMLPLSKPALASLAILTFVFVWNDFLGPLIYLTSDRNKTIQLGIRKFITQYSTEYSLIMAASVCALVPVVVVFLLMQRFFITGIAATSLKE